jgi:hypothetical protein
MDPLEANAPGQHQPIPDLEEGDMEVIHLGPMSLDFGSSVQERSNTGLSVNQENTHDDLDVVLAIPTTPNNFLHLELQPEDLMNDEEMQQAILSDDSLALHNGGHAISQNTSLQNVEHFVPQNDNMLLDLNLMVTDSQDVSPLLDLNQLQLDHLNSEIDAHLNSVVVPSLDHEQGQVMSNLQVGMTLLLENLDIDPGMTLNSSMPLNFLKSSISANGIRLWAKHFVTCGDPSGIKVPRCWSDFFTLTLLHPSRFDWAKAILESKAWKMIIRETSSEAKITFSIPSKCPTSAPVECSSQA